MSLAESPRQTFAQRLGLETPSPFTKTPAKRIMALLGYNPLEEERNKIRDWRSTDKRARWDRRKTEIGVDAMCERSMSEAEHLMFEDRAGFYSIVNPLFERALLISDATQGEIDFLTGKSKKDPRPMHEINYDAGNDRRGEQIIVDFTEKRPFVSIDTEMRGTTQLRNDREGTTDMRYVVSGLVIREKLARRRGLRIGNLRIPLPPKIEIDHFGRYLSH